MVQLSEQERITLLMMIGYGDRRRSFQEATDLFNQSFLIEIPFLNQLLIEYFKTLSIREQ